MRPVRLDMDGFASFRDKTVLDFTDTDYFVLVGATGAGKSTVIDAITFALYGTVPRWNDQRMITPALAPTATRGVVRLVFDADGQRYAVAREARRSGGKTSRVSMHASRLERLHDPDDLDGEADVLAAESEVTKAVEDLLGLSYEHFTTCVALPQGEFAEFLHAKASDRQDILSSLLGYQLYDQLQSRANSRARDRRAARDALEATLASYDDATEQQASDLTGRADRLSQLQTWLAGTGLPDLKQAALAVTGTGDRLDELTAQQQALAAAQVPPGVADLDAALDAATGTLAEATKAHDAAEAADTLAAEKASAFRPRHELLTLRQQWDDLAKTSTDLPALDAQVTDAVTVHREAKQATDGTEHHSERLRVAAECAADTADRAQQAVTLAAEQTAALATVTIPHDLDDLTTALAVLRTRHAELDAETDAAEEAYRAGQAALGSAPSEATLSTGLRPATIVHDALTADLAAWNDRDQATDALATAADAAATAAGALTAARANLDAARLADEAGALRAHLQPGQPCPVCEQQVTTVPGGHDTSHVAAAEKELASAQSRCDQAADEHARLDRDHRDTAAARAETLRHVETARADLHTALRNLYTARDQPDAGASGRTGKSGAAAPSQTATSRTATTGGPDLAALLNPLSTPITPDTAPGDLTRAAHAAAHARHVFDAAAESRRGLQHEATAADTRRSRASDARRALDRDSLDLDERSRAAATELQKTRDTVAGLGAPMVDTADLITAWNTLTRWAAAERATRSAQLPALREAAADAAATAGTAGADHTRAAASLTQLREQQNTAAATLARITQIRDQTADRQQKLSAALTGQPSGEQVAELIAELDRLDQAARAARGALTEARQVRTGAQQTVGELNALARDSRIQLATMRDPLTRYGAPAIAEDTLAAAWNQLDGWARTKETTLTGDITKARNAADHAAKEYQAAVAALSDALLRAGLLLPDGHTPASELHTAVTREVAGAAAAARIAAKHAADRFRERERLHKHKDEAAEQAQVAATLASLLRSDAFQAWLLESALTSLVADASDLLLDMSSGQFELRIQSKDIEVIDHNDADSTRPVRTLSGGETFQASLALALALSRQVSSLAASGAAKLESIFLDEGFGTLDETSLDVVAATLENLAATGERMVGVITHVPALADQIPVRFQVTRTGAKSRIERITA
jgi:DNA repair protein SbcC/Rad50